MSPSPISRSPDLKRLRDEGYEVSVQGGYLVLDHVPYVDERQKVQYGRLLTELSLAGDVTTPPRTHVALFAGSIPCDRSGSPLTRIINDSTHRQLANGLSIDHSFSSKPLSGSYSDYYEQMTAYVGMLSGHAESIDPAATARTFRVVEDDDDSPFLYRNTASSRSGLDLANEKLQIDRVAIVGLGGTGAYILDFVAKTPVRELHLFDGDVFLQHNAFRAPGAPSCEDLERQFPKVNYLAELYSKMRNGVTPHPYFLDVSSLDELREMQFVFLAIDRGGPRRLIVEQLSEWGVPFIDVGMGVQEDDGSVGGILRVTTVTSELPLGTGNRGIPFGELDGDNDYSRNIQIAELNALNASLAVIRWKKYAGFYRDLEREHSTIFTIDGNHLLNEDRA